jgi:hypothetical protein
MPSTQANAMRRSANKESLSSIHRSAQSAFFLMQGTEERVPVGQHENWHRSGEENALVSMAWNRWSRSRGSRM